jgi:hypothetical protein
MKKLPKPKGEHGYTYKQIQSICKSLKIDEDLWWGFYGVNTCALDSKGLTNYFIEDVERTLYLLGHKLGKYHIWD